MRNPRTYLLLLATLLVVVSLPWLPDGTNLAGANPQAVAAQTVPMKRASWGAAEVFGTPAGLSTTAADVPAAYTQELPSGDNRLVAEMCDLQLMAEGTGLALDSRQWSALAAVLLRAQAARHAFEAQIATSQVIAPGKYRLEIPAYVDAGEALRGEFAAELGAALGETVATDVLVKLSGKLEGRFAGFGVGVQTLDITANPEGEPGDVQVTRTVQYWNSVDGHDRLTTRREIHFPGLEDPAGDTWGALLAMVNVTGTGNGPG